MSKNFIKSMIIFIVLLIIAVIFGYLNEQSRINKAIEEAENREQKAKEAADAQIEKLNSQMDEYNQLIEYGKARGFVK